jgi:virginiamycin B lyase
MLTRVLACVSFMGLLLGCATPTASTATPAAPPAERDVPTPGAAPAATQELAPMGGGSPAVTAQPGQIREFEVSADSHPHDVAPAPDGTVWYTAQGSGALGRLDPATGENILLRLPEPSAPHGVIVGPDGAPWVTDSGQNAIVRVDPETETIQVFPLPQDRPTVNLNTAAFDGDGILWFTGQSGFYGRLNPATSDIEVFDAPRGRGPYGITATPKGEIYYASLAGSHIAHVNRETGEATIIEPPTPNQGARRVWSDSQGRIWVSEWNAGQLGLYDPASGMWREWRLPGDAPQPYAVYVDDQDVVWISDFGANALARFDPQSETFDMYPFPTAPASVRQLLGRPGEVWGAESALGKLFVLVIAP